jgi:hypothetical protein
MQVTEKSITIVKDDGLTDGVTDFLQHKKLSNKGQLL